MLYNNLYPHSKGEGLQERKGIENRRLHYILETFEYIVYMIYHIIHKYYISMDCNCFCKYRRTMLCVNMNAYTRV